MDRLNYLYEALGDDRFQELCAALVASEYENVRSFPPGQPDGGRDITADHGTTVFQVKFTRRRVTRPATWVQKTLRDEAPRIRALAGGGCKRYVLLTNVQGSGVWQTGDIDKVEALMRRFSADFHVQMEIRWKSDLDDWVRRAPVGIRFSFPEMLMGSEAILALLQSSDSGDQARDRAMLLDYVGTCWQREKRVKFAQVDMRSNLLNELFVDVSGRDEAGQPIDEVAKHLLSPPPHRPFTLIEGIPGQGKSTVVQFVCQVHRATFLGREELQQSGEVLSSFSAEGLRLPVRVDLADYALWASGGDPWSMDTSKGSARPRRRADIESFLVGHFRAATSGQDLEIEDIRRILDRLATLLVFDGLDEVASEALRSRVVREIDEFIARQSQAWSGNMQVIVTTRPNASGLPSPDVRRFWRISLIPLSQQQRKRYVRRWAKAQRLEQRQIRRIEAIFDDRTSSPHIAQLADNPMQLTILLHLINTKGDALPADRTSLYRQYMSLFLDREAMKSRIVLENRRDIEEATSYMGWYMHGSAESDSSASRLERGRIVKLMTMYLAGIGRRHAPVEDLFTAMNERVWVLTSKVSGTYEFDLQGVREFFAARFLYEFAQSDPDTSYFPEQALVEMLGDSYWSNTARFLAGHFTERELAEVGNTMLNHLLKADAPRQSLATSWMILADGIFNAREVVQDSLASYFAEELPLRLTSQEGDAHVSALSPENGGKSLSWALRTKYATLGALAARVSAQVGGSEEFIRKWVGDVKAESRTSPWRRREEGLLRSGIHLGAGEYLDQGEIARLSLDTPGRAVAAIECGVTPAEDSEQANRMLNVVLDGHASMIRARGTSMAADLVRLASPRVFMEMANDGKLPNTKERSSAMLRMRSRMPDVTQDLLEAMRSRKEQRATTGRWVNTSIALVRMFGRATWLATEIATMGAALPADRYRTGGDRSSVTSALIGPQMDYGQWVPNIRANAADVTWWRQYRPMSRDHHAPSVGPGFVTREHVPMSDEDLAKGTWLLGLLAVAREEVVAAVIDEVASTIGSLEPATLSSLAATTGRFGTQSWIRRLDTNAIPIGDLDPVARLLISHFARDPFAVLGTDWTTLKAMSEMPGSATVVNHANHIAFSDPSQVNLAGLASLGARNGEPLPIGYLPVDVARRVLSSPGEFNVHWLVRADESIAHAAKKVPFRARAERKWGIG